jgi:hypothetical protein
MLNLQGRPKLSLATLKLSMEFRDMKCLEGERELKATRAQEQLALLREEKMFTLIWGKCLFNGVWYRVNGNHTSNLMTACLQQSVLGSLDETSSAFVDEYLSGGKKHGTVILPPVEEDTVPVLVEAFTADDYGDLINAFRRYDAKGSARNGREILRVYQAEYPDLIGLEKKKVGYALAGVLTVGKNPQAFGFTDGKQVAFYARESNRGAALRHEQVRKAVAWVIETVPFEDLYTHVAGSHICVEAYLRHGEDEGANVVRRLAQQVEDEEEPGFSWYTRLTKKRNRPTKESLVKEGRKVITFLASDKDKPAA